ncbi:MAG: hypothetical protein ACK55Z_30520, partial [bacterium]
MRFGGFSLGTFLGCSANNLPDSSPICARIRSTFFCSRFRRERFSRISSFNSSGVMSEMRLCLCFLRLYSPVCVTTRPLRKFVLPGGPSLPPCSSTKHRQRWPSVSCEQVHLSLPLP